MTDDKALVVPYEAMESTEFDWGRVEFFASDTVGPATEQSLGRAIIYPGRALPKHYHAVCTEVVHVLEGTITHTIQGAEVARLRKGDTVIVPRNLPHQATNVGETDAVLLISFSAPRRDFIVVE